MCQNKLLAKILHPEPGALSMREEGKFGLINAFRGDCEIADFGLGPFANDISIKIPVWNHHISYFMQLPKESAHELFPPSYACADIM